MRSTTRPIVALLAIALLGAEPAPVPSASPPDVTWCPITPVVVPVDDTHVALGFSTPFPAGRSSGVVSLWTADARYDVRFEDAIVLHYGHAAAGMPVPVPIVLRFPAPVRIDAAAVTSLDGPAGGPCDPLYVPWRPRSTIVGSEFTTETPTAAYQRRVAEAVPRDAPAPVPYAPPLCDVRYAPPKTVHAFQPRPMRYNGRVNVLVTVGTDGKAIGVETLLSSGSSAVDAVAKDAAARSQYQAEIFDCRKIVGTYIFSVEFTTR